MKHILLFFLFALSVPAFSQITTDSVTGTWVNTEYNGQEQKLSITKDSVTVFTQYQSGKDSNEWLTISYSGSYTIEKGEKIHVIFNDKPREEAFYKVVRGEDGTLKIVVQMLEGRKKVDVIYKRE